MEVLIEKLDHQGRGLCHIDGKITFVKNALPNEIVEVEIIKSYKNYNEAYVTKYIKKSEKRIESICPYYEECGGCDLLHISYEEQLKYKEDKVKEIMSKYADINDKVLPVVRSDNNYNYRNKVTLKANGKLGYHKKKTNDIVNVDYCYLVNNKLNEKIKEINKIGLEKEIDEVILRSINEDEVSLTINLQKGEINNNKYKNIADNVAITKNKNILNISNKSKIIGNLKEITYKVSPTAFFQVNTNQTIKLYEKILEYVKEYDKPSVLDLYCGTGTIGIYVSKYCKKVLGIEINKNAIVDANENKKINNITNIEFIAGDTKEVLNKNNFKADIVIVDPPRAGLAKEVINDLFKINSKAIIYVSCDPITLARDLKLLQEKYIVEEITPFDMFPNTYHVENIVLLKKKEE